MRFGFVLPVLAATLLVSLTATDEAAACGGCFAPPSQSTVVSAHRMALSISTKQTVLWDQIQYDGDPDSFAWVLPVKPGAVIEVSSDAWFDTLDAGRTGSVAQADFADRFQALLDESAPARGGQGGNAGTWTEWNRMIGGSFLAHPWSHVWVKIDDPDSPITAPFKGEPFEITDETYTFTRDSFSRDNVRVLLSIDVSRMTPEELKRENRPWDHDYALSWIRTDGRGRVFYAAHGHEARVYATRPMLEHYLAGIQYALGDLDANARPRPLP